MLYSVEIGRNIVRLRKQRNISQEQLALRSDVSVSRLRDIEHGRANATIDTLESLAATLNVSLPILFWLHLEDETILELIRKARSERIEAPV